MIDKCPECGSNNIRFIEYPHDHPDHYDGISEIYCRDCGTRNGRWSRRILKDGEYEKPHGRES